MTEEKLVGTLKLGKLMHEGEEEVVWRNFVTNFWKIIDEVNRLTPYAQDILLSLLAEGTVKYYDSIITISKYCLYATINPRDVGTFDLSHPFLDRFGISVPISMPASQDLQLILTGKDEKYSGVDELVQVPKVLTLDELME
ncbi:MAG: AAA family ATPase, partial [Promethearchaeota archaeon]